MVASSSKTVKRTFAAESLPVLMVEQPPALLVEWHKKLLPNQKDMVKSKIGNLTDLLKLNITSRRDLTCALLNFWDPSSNTFRFSEMELTPTLEEMAGFIGLELKDKKTISPTKIDHFDFFRNLKLLPNPAIHKAKMGWIDASYLYERFGTSESFDLHLSEFHDNLTQEQWSCLRPKVFVLAFLGMVVFPQAKNRISIQLSGVVELLFGGLTNATIVPMILGSLFRALTEAQSGREKFFSGCNLLLQLWFVEHLIPHPSLVPVKPRKAEFLLYHPSRTSGTQFPETMRDWVVFLRNLTSEQVLWQYQWFRFFEVITGCRDRPFLVLIGLLGAQPYSPVRVLRQLGRIQDIPRVEDMSAFAYDFASKEPFSRAQLWGLWETRVLATRGSQELNRFKGIVTALYETWYKSQPPLLIKPPRSGHGLVDMQAKFDLKVKLVTNQFKRQRCKDNQRLKELEKESQERAKTDAFTINELQKQLTSTLQEKQHFAEQSQIQAQRVETFQGRIEFYQNMHFSNLQTINELRHSLTMAYQHNEDLIERKRQADIVIGAAEHVAQRSANRLSMACYYSFKQPLDEIGRRAPRLASQFARDFEDMRYILERAPPREPVEEI